MTPLRSRYVTLHLAVVGDLPALVETEDARSIVVSLAVRPPAELARAVQRPVRIECMTPRGIQHVTGTASWDAARPEELRIVRESDELVQRRNAVRVQAVVPALLVVADGGGARATTTTVNLSGTGLLLVDPLDLELGATVRVELELEAGARPVVVEGPLTREGGRGMKGMRFDIVAREDEQRLARFIADRQRAELRIARAA
jgi:hypothetical protein